MLNRYLSQSVNRARFFSHSSKLLHKDQIKQLLHQAGQFEKEGRILDAKNLYRQMIFDSAPRCKEAYDRYVDLTGKDSVFGFTEDFQKIHDQYDKYFHQDAQYNINQGIANFKKSDFFEAKTYFYKVIELLGQNNLATLAENEKIILAQAYCYSAEISSMGNSADGKLSLILVDKAIMLDPNYKEAIQLKKSLVAERLAYLVSSWDEITNKMTLEDKYRLAVESPTDFDYHSPQFLLFRAVGFFAAKHINAGLHALELVKSSSDSQVIRVAEEVDRFYRAGLFSNQHGILEIIGEINRLRLVSESAIRQKYLDDLCKSSEEAQLNLDKIKKALAEGKSIEDVLGKSVSSPEAILKNYQALSKYKSGW